MTNNELLHFGIKRRSGRYPYGSGERPFQSNPQKGKVVKKGSPTNLTKQQQDRRKAQLAAIERQRREQAFAEEKAKILKSGKASDVMKYKGEWTNNELNDAYRRLQLERDIGAMAASEKVTKVQKFDRIMRGVKVGTEWADVGIAAYNDFAAIWNATPAGRKDSLTLINKGGGKKK